MDSVGKRCIILKPVRGHEGKIHYQEHPKILREVHNLDRLMYLVEFEDKTTTFLFPQEIKII